MSFLYLYPSPLYYPQILFLNGPPFRPVSPRLAALLLSHYFLSFYSNPLFLILSAPLSIHSLYSRLYSRPDSTFLLPSKKTFPLHTLPRTLLSPTLLLPTPLVLPFPLFPIFPTFLLSPVSPPVPLSFPSHTLSIHTSPASLVFSLFLYFPSFSRLCPTPSLTFLLLPLFLNTSILDVSYLLCTLLYSPVLLFTLLLPSFPYFSLFAPFPYSPPPAPLPPSSSFSTLSLYLLPFL